MPILLSKGIHDVSNDIMCGYRCPPNKQQATLPNAFNRCPHSHVRRLDAGSWIKLKLKHNIEVEIECAMRNERIDGLTINHYVAPLPKKEWMWTLDVKEMESSSKIDLKDVLWWMYIKNAYRFGALVIVKLSKKRCISLVMGGKPSHITRKHH